MGHGYVFSEPVASQWVVTMLTMAILTLVVVATATHGSPTVVVEAAPTQLPLSMP